MKLLVCADVCNTLKLRVGEVVAVVMAAESPAKCVVVVEGGEDAGKAAAPTLAVASLVLLAGPFVAASVIWNAKAFWW